MEGVPFDKDHLGKWTDVDLSPSKAATAINSHNSPPPKSGEWKPKKVGNDQSAIAKVFNEIEATEEHVDGSTKKKKSKRGSKKSKGK